MLLAGCYLPAAAAQRHAETMIDAMKLITLGFVGSIYNVPLRKKSRQKNAEN